MTNITDGIEVLFIAGFGPITQSHDAAKALYIDTLNLPLKPIEGDSSYFHADSNELPGAKHFALWPLAHASNSCFGTDRWPAELPVPQAWLEFDVADMNKATEILKAKGYHLIVANRTEPWGQIVTRFLSPEGILVAVTHTPWMRK